MPTGLEAIRAARHQDKIELRKLWIICLVIFLAGLFYLLCFRGRGLGYVQPLQVFQNLAAFFKLKFAGLFSRAGYESLQAAVTDLPYYAETIARFRTGILLGCGGAILALSGLVYQSATRNPMAVPTMLGVSSGVNLAQVLLVINLGESVLTLSKFHYIYSYGISAIALLIILVGGKLAGGKNAGVADMLIIGTIVNRILQLIVNYYRGQMDTDQLELLMEFSEESVDMYDHFSTLGILAGIALVILIPLFALRFRYNAIAFSDEDAETMGVRPQALRVYGLVAGALLTTTAMMFCGNVGMVAMLVPHICRYMFGAEFSKLFWASILVGALLMVIAEILSRYMYLDDMQVPIGSIISIIALPILLWVMIRQKRGWE